jgi:hypothetical protein
MKKKNTYATINQNLREHFETGTRVNHPNIQKGCGLSHELKKMEIYTKLRYEGRSVVVNGKLKNGQIPDLTVIDLKEPIIYEIMDSEKELKNGQ